MTRIIITVTIIILGRTIFNREKTIFIIANSKTYRDIIIIIAICKKRIIIGIKILLKGMIKKWTLSK